VIGSRFLYLSHDKRDLSNVTLTSRVEIHNFILIKIIILILKILINFILIISRDLSNVTLTSRVEINNFI